MRASGATEVHVRIACPPTRNPCYFGIDFPDPGELVASGRSVKQVKELIGADSCGYLSIKGLRSVLDKPQHFCMGCFDGKYVCETHQATSRQSLGKSCGGNIRNRYRSNM
jgi:amidophosphoribosyltransferase